MTPHRAPAWLRLAAFLLPLLVSLVSLAPAYAADQRAILDLVVNHVDRGEVVVVLRDGDALVSPEELGRAGLVGLAGRTEEVSGKKLVSLASLSPPLAYEVDEVALTLRVEAPARLLATTALNLSPSPPSGLEQRRDTSAFLNYAAHLAYPMSVAGYLEGGLSVDGNVLQSSLSAATSQGVVRGLTSFTADDHADLRRWVAGDAYVSGGPLGAGAVIGGLSVTKTWAVDPYFVHTPSLGFTGAATTPSLLDVYVNGVLVKSIPVPPGPFNVQNLQVPTGAGEARYVVRDLFGRQEAISSPYYMGAGALARGLSEYTYALGARRLNLGTESFDYGAPGVLGRHRYGFTDTITAGMRLEGAPGLVSGGPSLTLVLPVGQIDLEVAGSAAATGSGVAALAGYTFTSRRISAGVMARAVTARYATLSLAPEDDRELARVNAFTSVAIGTRAGISAQYAFAIDRDLGPTFHVGLTSTVQIIRRLSLVLGLGRTYDWPDGASVDAFAGLTLALDGGITISTGALQGAGVHEGYAEVDKPLPPGDGFGFRAYGEASRTPSALGTAQYQGPYGRYQVTAQDGPGGPSAALDVSGAVVFVSGAGVLPTRPVQDGFAVIHVPGAPHVRGYLDNQEIGHTNGSGDMVLPALLPYYGNRVSIADVDVAMDRSVTAVERIIAPPYRGGALVVFEAKRARFFRGKLRVVKGDKAIPPAYGELTVTGPAGEVTSPLGADGEFELSDLPPGRHPARVEHTGGTCAFALELPAAEHAVTNLGEQRCVVSP